MRGLAGKTFIVAGGATGIGAGAAKRLGEEGANVVVGDINIAGAGSTVDKIVNDGGRAVATHFDLADELSAEALVNTAITQFGAVHGLFNVGADLSPQNLGRDRSLLDTDLDVWHRTLDVNVVGFVRTSRAVLPHLLENGGGSIVNTSSGAAVSAGDRLRPAYAASKSAVNALTRHIAGNWGPKGVRCNGVMPGLVMGELQERQQDFALQERFLREVPTTRLGRPSDLAAVVAFLLSDDAEWINGQVWAIDGGANMRA
ncbi:NAD(P)-dependent dehydrogenase, short-chain alcohol dehydrogenase family [Parafrankia irregularis]|uniref:NAD(P)-dependent dehydrogenase, short-chain alcohol dehydrogenase family n=1 Tax=Parafrankia irregularis TaxID=795642 RepID=A0A0S4R199_9ACTN|nr:MULTISPECIES: SDR family NAD(P)-dependent oxidoreductase [Parafrankia]MBE3203528.1 SDR family oxidoreductase [Parafrankia sp. CH37]CUU60972.1 NAD(P)-dependent dehydrogenase, short-chain alcohol dehydrogenase family [Parafrankia irregularis]